MSCPSLELLERFATGDLDTDESATVEEHNAQCDDCRQRLQEVKDNLRVVERVERMSAWESGDASVASGGSPPTRGGATFPAGAGHSPGPSVFDSQESNKVASDWFPGYEIAYEISRGGQGVVYRALQASTQREVAIKVLKDGHFGDRHEKARFEREVRVLGQLKHPNIVTIHDSGSVGQNAFYVMDYISGDSLDAYIADRKLSIDDNLKLFAKVCDAVHAAHLRGIIHRDLKPSNIRVDSAGEPYVLDFGLAKMTGDADGGSAAMTMTGQFLGSLPWSTPEQAEGIPSKIDMRTDVYSLGVILYQTLTGRFPYDVIGNMRDVLDRIMRAEPAPPSSIRPQINDEVETIILKCLNKSRDRRYQSAGDVARDIRLYLAGDPIEAKRDSGWYVFKKTVRRHRVPVASAAVFFMMITASLIVSLSLWRRAEDSLSLAGRRQAELETVAEFQASMLDSIDIEEMGRRAVSSMRELVKIGLDEREKDVDEAQSLLDGLDVAFKYANSTTLASRMLAENILGPAAETISERFAEQPLVEARLLQTVANAYILHGLHAQAQPLIERALSLRRRILGSDSPDSLTMIDMMGLAYSRGGQYDKAQLFYEEALEGRRRVLGDDHPDTLVSIHNLSALLRRMGRLAEAEQFAVEAVEGRRRVLGEQHPLTLASVAALAKLFRKTGRLKEAEQHYREVLEHRRALGDDELGTLAAINDLALVLRFTNQRKEALTLMYEALEGKRRILGDDHRRTLLALNNVGIVLGGMEGRAAEAEPYFRQALTGYRRLLGNDHPDTLQSLSNVGFALKKGGKLAEAEPYYREALEGRRRVLGPEHHATLESMNGLGSLLEAQGRRAEAEPLYAQAVDGVKRYLPDGYRHAAAFLSNYGRCLTKLGRHADAERLLLEAYATIDSSSIAQRRQLVATIERLVDLYEAWGKPAKAAEWRAKLPTPDDKEPPP